MDEITKEITHPKKLAFLENYPTFEQITRTAEAIGVCRKTIWQWMQDDEVFSNACNALKKEIESKLIEKHELNIDNMAFDPKIPSGTRFLSSISRLKALDDRYKDRVPETRLIGDITVKLAVPRPDYGQITEKSTVD